MPEMVGAVHFEPTKSLAHSPRIRLDEFPELVQALRNGDGLSARSLFAQLFESDNWNEALNAHPL